MRKYFTTERLTLRPFKVTFECLIKSIIKSWSPLQQLYDDDSAAALFFLINKKVLCIFEKSSLLSLKCSSNFLLLCSLLHKRKQIWENILVPLLMKINVERYTALTDDPTFIQDRQHNGEDPNKEHENTNHSPNKSSISIFRRKHVI